MSPPEVLVGCLRLVGACFLVEPFGIWVLGVVPGTALRFGLEVAEEEYLVLAGQLLVPVEVAVAMLETQPESEAV